MANTVHQPTAWPTRKLSAGVIAAAITQIVTPWLEHLSGVHWIVSGLGSEAVQACVTVGVGLLVGYFVKDRPNV